MSERLIEIFLPAKHRKEAQEILNTYDLPHWWSDRISDRQIVFRVLAAATHTEALLDIFQKRFYKEEAFKLIVLPVEARIPREVEKGEADSPGKTDGKRKQLAATPRISRDELRTQVTSAARLTGMFTLLTVISALVAAIGLMRDSVTIVIGAMVIAPLLGPNVALALATTLADHRMVRHAVRTLAAGTILVLGITLVLGALFGLDASAGEVISRTHVDFADLVLALAAGMAGVLSYTSGLSASLIGVMVAVALLPPLANCGLLLGSGQFGHALQAGLLFLTNLICINLAGVLMFAVQGIRPRTWWEAKKARRLTRIALTVWAGLFLILVLILVAVGSGRV